MTTFTAVRPSSSHSIASPRCCSQTRSSNRCPPDAKVLYGILLDRMSLSVKNYWLDEQSRVYIIFTTEEIMEALSCANQKACRLMLELEKDAGLIERKRQGLGKPSLIYVKNFAVSS